MKKLLFLLLLLPFIATAQYAEVSGNLGLMFASKPTIRPDASGSHVPANVKSTLNGYFSGRVSMNIRHIQFGAGADVFSIQFSQTVPQYTLVSGSLVIAQIPSSAIVARPALCPNVFLNYKFYLPGSYVYCGLTFGQFSNINGGTTTAGYPAEIIYPACKGWYYGGQVGYSIVTGNRTRINIEVAARYTDATLDNSVNPGYYGVLGWTQLSFPTSVGLRYRFTKS